MKFFRNKRLNLMTVKWTELWRDHDWHRRGKAGNCSNSQVKGQSKGRTRNGRSQASRVHVYTCTFLFLGVEKEQKIYVEIVESN